MKRTAVCILTLMTLVLPAQAQAPVVMIAKELVKGIIQSFVQDRLISMLSTMGPCGMPLGPTGGLATLAGLLGGGGLPGVGALAGMPGLPGMPGMPAMPALTGAGSLGSVAGIGTAGSIVGAAGASAQVAGVRARVEALQREQMAQLPPPEPGDDPTEAEEADESTPPDIAQLTQSLQEATPLSSAELDELGGLMERLATAMPSKANPCKPGELTQVLHSAADVPMGSGMLRMMLQPMRDMAMSVDDAHTRFGQMSATESAEYVALMADESRGWDAENRKAFIGMVETNFLGMPAPMQAQLLARLRRQGK